MKRMILILALVALLVSCGWRELGGRLSRALARGRTQAAALQTPASLDQLLTFSPSQIEQCDIALLNLLCAEGLPGAEGLNSQDCMATLDGWTERVRSETERHLYRYTANPREFESSEGYFRMLMMAVVVYEDFSVRYNPERISTPGALDPNDHFFADSRDLFLHGLLSTEVQSLKFKVQSPGFSSPVPLAEEGVTALRPAVNPQRSTINFHTGTCSSMPVLYVAIGRRLGYPLKLATTKSHVFIRWESAAERFDVEATGRGMNRYDDEHFKHWPFAVTEEEIQADGYLKSLTPVEELALFLSLRGHCLKEAGRVAEATASYAEAVRLAPGSRPYRLLLAAAQQGGGQPGVPAATPGSGPPYTYAQGNSPLPPPPAAPAAEAAPGPAAGATPRVFGTQDPTLNQPPDLNPLLKRR